MKETISFEYIDQITLRDPQATSDLLKVYVAQNSTNMRELQEALVLQNWPLLRKIAHKLKSSLALLGLSHSRSIAEQLERTGGEDLHQTHDLVAEVCRALTNAIEVVEKRLNA